MILSKRTIDILKNCSGINQSILIKKGSKIRTISELKNCLFEADIDEVFPCDFAIYDLANFLSVCGNSMKEANIEFVYHPMDKIKELEDDIKKYETKEEQDTGYLNLKRSELKSLTFYPEKLVFKKGIKEYTYFTAEPTLIVCPPEKSIEMTIEGCSFYLMKDVFDYLKRSAKTAKLMDLVIFGCQESNSIYAGVTNLINDTSNMVKVKIVNKLESDNWFLEVPERILVVKVENLKLIRSDYDVSFANGIIHFASINDSLKYWIALEACSKYFPQVEAEKEVVAS